MPKEPPSRRKKQHEKFKELARQLGADENEAAFEDRLNRIVKAKPKPASSKSR